MKTLIVNQNIIVSIIAVILLTYGLQGISYAQDAPDETLVEFADVNLAKVVREELELDIGNGVDIRKIPKAQLVKLTELWGTADGITDLTGLEYATQLRILYLGVNQIQDVTPLAQLTHLTGLYLNNNEIRDVTPLTQLAESLTVLDLRHNKIHDVAPLANLIHLEVLWLSNNPILDTFPLFALFDENPDLNIDIIKVGVPALKVSTPQPLAEATLNGSVVTLTLSSGTFDYSIENTDAVSVSGIPGATINRIRTLGVNDRQITVELEFDGYFDLDSILTFAVGAAVIANYDGTAITAQIPVSAQDYVQGPWLWMITDGADIARDYLALESGGAITEAQVAQNGVNEGDTVGPFQWTSGTIKRSQNACEKFCARGLFGGCRTLCWSNNINSTLNSLGLGTGANMEGYSAYALINLVSPRDQSQAMLFLKTGDAFKVWLNGDARDHSAATQLGCRTFHASLAFDPEVCTPDPVADTSDFEAGRSDFEDKSRLIPIPLKAGNNLLLIKVSQSGEYWGMEAQLDADFTTAIPKTVVDLTPTSAPKTPATDTALSFSPSPVQSPAIGEELTLSLNIAGGENVAGYQATVQFDTTALRYVKSSNSNYLPDGAFFAPPVVEGNLVKLNAVSLAGESEGNGTLATLTFEVVAMKASTLTLSDVLLSNSAGKTFAPQIENAKITESTGLTGDVNGDGTVNIGDLVLVASNLGKTGQNAADVNGDSIVNIADLVLVAGALGTSAAAPSMHPQSLKMLTTADIKLWLSQAQQLTLTDARSQRGILFLEQLLAVLVPKKTALLANYPNPFNPETWIPYHLAKDADVTLHIYAVNGTLVRTLALGHQPAGMYQTRSRAAYWDGKNQIGEPVASGVYFYTITAGDFTATRKMLIAK